MPAAVAVADDLGERLKSAIIAGLSERGIDAEVSVQAVPDVDMYRIYASSPKFRNLWVSERQDIIWKVVDERFSRAEMLRVSGVVPLTPDEIDGVWPENGAHGTKDEAR